MNVTNSIILEYRQMPLRGLKSGIAYRERILHNHYARLVQKILEELVAARAEAGLQVNEGKTKYMCKTLRFT